MPEETPRAAEPKKEEEPSYKLTTDQAPITTEHAITIAGKKLEYSVTVGMLPIQGETGETEAGIFYTYYAAKGDGEGAKGKKGASRPLMFSFNGGPGSSSIWLHLGAVGPKRAVLNPEGTLPPAPYELADNPYTWLAETDLVFIDPVGTGYSRPAKPSLADKFWGVKGDIESVAEFIRLFLSRFERWASPLYIVGESYGTTRAAGLSGYLIEKGIGLQGIVLVSSILNMQTARFHKGNDLPFILFLPSYTATAWYHKKLPKDLQTSLAKALEEAETFASGEYTLALSKGSRLSKQERARVVSKLSRLTGLSKEYVDLADLRIQIHRFCKELLRKERRTVGRLDSRFKGIDALGVGENPEHDPAMEIRPPYTAMFNDYVGRVLGYKTDAPYMVSAWGGPLSDKWDWGSSKDGYTDTSEALRAAFSKNPHMKVFVASGYYDLATPYFATEYTLAHMGLDPSLEANITTGEYEAGHMMYVHDASLKKLHADVAGFLQQKG